MSNIKGIIWDMDGVLIDSEGFWRKAMINQFKECGIHLSESDCAKTKGRKINEVVRFWNIKYDQAMKDELLIADRIIDNVCALIIDQGQALPGIIESLDFLRRNNVDMSIASSSSMKLINTVVDTLGIRDLFKVLHSAEYEQYGKPHPAVFLHAASKMNIESRDLLVIEDSYFGLIAAKAAQMKCIIIPESEEKDDPRWVISDRVYGSASDINWSEWLFTHF